MSIQVHYGLPSECIQSDMHVCFAEFGAREHPKSDWDLLDRNEIAKAYAFRTKDLRNAFISAHVFLRRCLGVALKQKPENIEFGVGLYGKPFLLNEALGLWFNLSHSGHCVMIGLSRKGPVGVDVETLKMNNAVIRIAEEEFTSSEISLLLSLRGEEQLDAFYRIWSAKEAFVKGLGRGLSLGLKSAEFSLSDSGSLCLVRSPHDCLFSELPVSCECIPCPDGLGYRAAAVLFHRSIQ